MLQLQERVAYAQVFVTSRQGVQTTETPVRVDYKLPLPNGPSIKLSRFDAVDLLDAVLPNVRGKQLPSCIPKNPVGISKPVGKHFPCFVFILGKRVDYRNPILAVSTRGAQRINSPNPRIHSSSLMVGNLRIPFFSSSSVSITNIQQTIVLIPSFFGVGIEGQFLHAMRLRSIIYAQQLTARSFENAGLRIICLPLRQHPLHKNLQTICVAHIGGCYQSLFRVRRVKKTILFKFWMKSKAPKARSPTRLTHH